MNKIKLLQKFIFPIFFCGLLFFSETIFAQAGATQQSVDTCVAKQNGRNGCRSVSQLSKGYCDIQFSYCSNSTTCVNNGGQWSGGQCSAKSSSTTQKTVSCSENATAEGKYCKCKYSSGYEVYKNGQWTGCDAEKAVVTCPLHQILIEGKCKCRSASGSFYEPIFQNLATGEKECTEDVQARQQSSQQTVQTSTNQALVNCMDQMAEQVQKCQDQADQAKTSCDEKKSNNKSLTDYQNILNNNANSAANSGVNSTATSGTGSASTVCSASGLMNSTGAAAVNSAKEDCEDDYNQCVSTCDSVDTSKIRQCLLKIRIDQYGKQLPEDGNYFSSRFSQINSDLEDAKKDCKVDAKQGKDSLSELLQSLAQTALQAKQCECQITASGTGCNSIPSLQDCLPGGKYYGQSVCSVWSSSLKCVYGGTDYNSKDCVCLRDPSNTLCRSLTTTTAQDTSISQINGTGVTSTLPSGSSSTGAGINIGDIKDTNDATALDPKSGNNTMAQFAAPAGGSAGAGGGGSGSASSTGESENGTQAEDGGKNTSAFGQIKSVVSSLLGLKKNNFDNSSGIGGSRVGNGNPDFNKWRPNGLRNPASAYGIAARNTDIWTTMNRRYRLKDSTFMQP